MTRWLLVLVLLAFAAPAAAQVNTAIVPAEGRTTWAPGVTTGIPARGTICATVQAATYGNGASESSAGIQAAIAACPIGQTVQLSAGTFRVNNYLLLDKGITLRGAGPTVTTLRKTNGAVANSYMAEEYEAVVVIGPNRYPRLAETSVNLSADGIKGSLAVTVANATGFAAGQFVLLDEDDYATAAWRDLPPRNGMPTDVKIWASDRIVFAKHNPPAPEDDPFPDSLTWFSRAGRPLNEIKEIAAVSGNTITFTTPLHAAYPTAKFAQLTGYSSAHVQGAGLEDLAVSGGSDGNVVLVAAAYSWVKNVESTAWLGPAVAADQCFQVEIRDSFVHDGVWPYPGGGGYGISMAGGSSEVLVENNVVSTMNKVIVVRSSGAGSVVGYNYMDNGFIGNYPAWVEVGINGSHMVGGHHVLFEGNQSNNYDSDDTHGNAFAMTIFRNHLVGVRRNFPGQHNGRAAGLMYGSWWHAFIGNVLGEAGKMDGWTYEQSAGSSIWKFGYAPSQWGQAPDPKVLSTALRDGNFDYLTSSVKWDRPPQPIPASLYLAAKPAFFGSRAWPWVDPTGATTLAVLPARERYETWFSGGQPPPVRKLRAIVTAPPASGP